MKNKYDYLGSYRKCDDCKKHMIGIMAISDKSAPRVICRSCERERAKKEA